MASCADDCGVPNLVTIEYDYPGTTHDTTATQYIGTSANHDVEPHGISNACGTGEADVVLKVMKTDGLTAFKVTFTFGCGQCPEAS